MSIDAAGCTQSEEGALQHLDGPEEHATNLRADEADREGQREDVVSCLVDPPRGLEGVVDPHPRVERHGRSGGNGLRVRKTASGGDNVL